MNQNDMPKDRESAIAPASLLSHGQAFAIERSLSSIGWTLLGAEIDFSAGHARVSIRHFDGAELTLDVKNGKGTLTRERLERKTVSVGRKGDRFLAERLSHTFLGRVRFDGARAGMRVLCDEIAATSGVTRIAARAAVLPLMSKSAVAS